MTCLNSLQFWIFFLREFSYRCHVRWHVWKCGLHEAGSKATVRVTVVILHWWETNVPTRGERILFFDCAEASQGLRWGYVCFLICNTVTFSWEVLEESEQPGENNELSDQWEWTDGWKTKKRPGNVSTTHLTYLKKTKQITSIICDTFISAYKSEGQHF